MKRWISLTAVLVTACTAPEAKDSGADRNGDAGPVSDGASADPDAAALVEFYGRCSSNTDCSSGICVDVLLNGFCSSGCQEDSDCDQGDGQQWGCMDLGLPAGKICAPTCNDGEGCPPHHLCLLNVGAYSGPEDLCYDLTEQRCQKQDDCAEGTYCTVAGGGRDFTFMCSEQPPGTLTVGQQCDTGINPNIPCSPAESCPGGYQCDLANSVCRALPETQCASYVCTAQGTCAGPCLDQNDCPADHRCQAYQFYASQNTPETTDDVLAPVTLCTPFGGTAADCSTDQDCSNGEICSRDVTGELEYTRLCRAPGSGGVGIGELCSDDPTTPEVYEAPVACASNMCAQNGHCTHYCETAADCGTPEADWQCRPEQAAHSMGVTASICVKGAQCQSDSDCPVSGEVCLIDADAMGFFYRCGQPTGRLAGMASCDNAAAFAINMSCSSNADCTDLGANHICHGYYHQCVQPPSEQCQIGTCPESGYCGALCQTDADCGDADFVCAGESAVFDTLGTGTPDDDRQDIIKMCKYFPGSRNDCQNDAQCTVDREVCTARRALDGTVLTQCARLTQDGATAGEDCGRVGAQVVFCQSGLCDYRDGRELSLRGTCASVCSTSDDCPLDLTCQTLSMGGDNSDLPVCRRQGALQ